MPFTVPSDSYIYLFMLFSFIFLLAAFFSSFGALNLEYFDFVRLMVACVSFTSLVPSNVVPNENTPKNTNLHTHNTLAAERLERFRCVRFPLFIFFFFLLLFFFVSSIFFLDYSHCQSIPIDLNSSLLFFNFIRFFVDAPPTGSVSVHKIVDTLQLEIYVIFICSIRRFSFFCFFQ